MRRQPVPPTAALEIRPYDPRWADRGRALAAELRALLGAQALRVEHIGSTSIPGMAAKPVFDLQIAVADLADATPAFDAPLADWGLVRRPFERDHVPAGRDDAPERWAKRFWSGSTPQHERINLHVRVAGAPNERLALLFRDWFRAHPVAVPAYSAFKRRLADIAGDLETYADAKDPVVDVVLTAAEEWALATGWRP